MSRKSLSLIIGFSFVVAAFFVSVGIIIASKFDANVIYYSELPLNFPVRLAPRLWSAVFPPDPSGAKSISFTLTYLGLDVLIYSGVVYAALAVLDKLRKKPPSPSMEPPSPPSFESASS